MRRAVLLAPALLLLAACGATSPAVTEESAMPAYTPGPAVASAAEARAAASESEASAAASSSAAVAAESARASAAAAAAAREAVEAARRTPTIFTGSGDDVVTITKPEGATVVIATITGNDAGRYFGVSALDGDRDSLVNTTDPYSGTTLLDANRGGTTQLEVQATGPWSITLTNLQYAPTFNGHAEGTGDAVLISQTPGRTATITGNQEGRYFGVRAYGDGSGQGLVNTTDPYSGTVPWPSGTNVFVVISAEGSWTVDVQ